MRSRVHTGVHRIYHSSRLDPHAPHTRKANPQYPVTLVVEPSQRRSALSPSPIAHLAVIIDHIPMTSHEHPSGTAKEWRASRRPPHPTVAAYDSLRVGRVGLGDVWFQLEICPQGTQRSRWSRLYSCSFGRTRHGEAVAVMEDGADDGRLRVHRAWCVRACVAASGLHACVPVACGLSRMQRMVRTPRDEPEP